MNNKNMITKKIWWFPIIGLIMGLIALPLLPDQIPIHWNNAGEVDNYGTRIFILLLPILSMGVLLIGNILPTNNPKKQTTNQMRREYKIIYTAVTILLFCVEVVIILITLGIPIEINTIISIGTGIILLIIGNYIPKLPQNGATGIKTIWGYYSEEIWNKTQRLSGKIWTLAGILIIICSPLPGSNNSISLNTIIIIILLIIPRIYGLILSKSQNKQ